MIFKPGDKIICIYEAYPRLIKGKVYKVVRTIELGDRQYVFLENLSYMYNSVRFEKFIDEPKPLEEFL